MTAWLAKYKYRGDERLLRLLSAMLMHAYRKLMEVEDLQQGQFDCISYVPLSEERLRERGFNQAEQLAREMGVQLKLPLISTLIRVRHTPKQSFKRRSERLHDLSGAFVTDPVGILKLKQFPPSVNQSAHNPAYRILLIDDVYTTGSTLHQCADIICEHIPAQVYSLTWAR